MTISGSEAASVLADVEDPLLSHRCDAFVDRVEVCVFGTVNVQFVVEPISLNLYRESFENDREGVGFLGRLAKKVRPSLNIVTSLRFTHQCLPKLSFGDAMSQPIACLAKRQRNCDEDAQLALG